MVGEDAEGSEAAKTLCNVRLTSSASNERVWYTSAHAILFKLLREFGFDG